MLIPSMFLNYTPYKPKDRIFLKKISEQTFKKLLKYH